MFCMILRIAAAFTLTVTPALAGQDVYQKLTPEDVRDILILNGLPAETDSIDGDSVVADERILVREEIFWVVYLYNCDEAGCDDIQFRTAFDDAKPTLEQMNQWNRGRRFTRAYATPEGSAVLEMDINARGGITVENLSELLPLWRASIMRFNATLLAAEESLQPSEG